MSLGVAVRDARSSMTTRLIRRKKMSTSIARYTPATLSRPGLLGGTVFDAFFNDFLSPERFGNHLSQSVSGYPVVDIYHDDQGSTVMEFALAGFSRDDLSIDVKPEKRSITVSATGGIDEGTTGSRRIARRSFTKTYVNYDDNLDLGASTATFENGLLTVTVPPRPETQPLQIEIT